MDLLNDTLIVNGANPFLFGLRLRGSHPTRDRSAHLKDVHMGPCAKQPSTILSSSFTWWKMGASPDQTRYLSTAAKERLQQKCEAEIFSTGGFSLEKGFR